MSNSTESSQGFKERRIERALKHVSDYWIPINQPLLEKLKKGVKEGIYDNDIGGLVAEVKTDFSLFSHCLRSLLAMMSQDSNTEIAEDFNPVSFMTEHGAELRQVINLSSPQSLSIHDLNQANSAQLARFEEVLVSSSTAEVLAEKYEVIPDAAYSAAILRQLGLTLIAWNYPSLYQESVANLREDGDSLDAILTNKLGFSPGTLAIRILKSWGMSNNACTNLGLHDEMDEEEQLIRDSISGTLESICQVSEALARANNPQLYPTAKDDWDYARAEIEEVLGEDGMAAIREHFADMCENYVTLTPHIFSGGLVLDPDYHALNTEADSPPTTNPYIIACKPRLRGELRRLYSRLHPEHISQDLIRQLIRETIPSAGFSGGCVFTIDPGLMMLVPQIEIGELDLRNFEVVDYSIVASNSDIVAVAYQTAEPVVAYRRGRKHDKSRSVAAIAGAIGHSKRVGVLYLEIPQELFIVASANQLLHFNALRCALNDCLNLP